MFFCIFIFIFFTDGITKVKVRAPPPQWWWLGFTDATLFKVLLVRSVLALWCVVATSPQKSNQFVRRTNSPSTSKQLVVSFFFSADVMLPHLHRHVLLTSLTWRWKCNRFAFSFFFYPFFFSKDVKCDEMQIGRTASTLFIPLTDVENLWLLALPWVLDSRLHAVFQGLYVHFLCLCFFSGVFFFCCLPGNEKRPHLSLPPRESEGSLLGK